MLRAMMVRKSLLTFNPMVRWRRKYSSNLWLQVTLNGMGVVEYEENLMGDPDWTVEYSGKDLMIILCEDKKMGPAVPSWSENLSPTILRTLGILRVNPR